MTDPRVPVTLARRHREALEALAATYCCPLDRLLDEAVELYLRRLGAAAPLAAGTAVEAAAARPSDPAWTSVLR